MIFSKMLPISNGASLVSGGEVSIMAKQNGEEVYLKPYHRVVIYIPTTGTPPTDMKLFTGEPNVDTSIYKTNWVLPTVDSTSYNIGIFVYPGWDTLGIVSDRLKWINCDHFIGTADLQNCTVGITATGGTLTSYSGLYVYAIFDDMKLVRSMNWLTTGSNLNYTLSNVPASPVHFVAFSLINGQFFGGSVKATPTNGANFTLNIFPQDAKAFKAQLNDF